MYPVSVSYFSYIFHTIHKESAGARIVYIVHRSENCQSNACIIVKVCTLAWEDPGIKYTNKIHGISIRAVNFSLGYFMEALTFIGSF